MTQQLLTHLVNRHLNRMQCCFFPSLISISNNQLTKTKHWIIHIFVFDSRKSFITKSDKTFKTRRCGSSIFCRYDLQNLHRFYNPINESPFINWSLFGKLWNNVSRHTFKWRNAVSPSPVRVARVRTTPNCLARNQTQVPTWTDSFIVVWHSHSEHVTLHAKR